MKYHPLVAKIKQLFTDQSYWFEIFEHSPVRTSEEAAAIRTGYSLHQGAKAIIVSIKKSDKNKYFAMLVFPADLRFNNKKVKTLTDSEDIRFATETEIAEITDGVEIGGVPPFGNLFNLEVYADPKLFANEKIIFNAGDRSVSIAVLSKNYQELVKPLVADITSEPI